MYANYIYISLQVQKCIFNMAKSELLCRLFDVHAHANVRSETTVKFKGVALSVLYFWWALSMDMAGESFPCTSLISNQICCW